MSQSHDRRVFLGQLAAPGVNLARIGGRVKRQPELMEAVIAGVASGIARTRLGASKLLRILSERAPELVYSHFDFFARLLEHENSILR